MVQQVNAACIGEEGDSKGWFTCSQEAIHVARPLLLIPVVLWPQRGDKGEWKTVGGSKQDQIRQHSHDQEHKSLT